MASTARQLKDTETASPSSIVVAKPATETPVDNTLRKIAEQSGKGYYDIVREIVALGFGPGRVSFRDYVKLRLFDDQHYAGCDKKTVVGQRRNRDISVAVNYRIDWYAMLENKIASICYLGAFGLPVIPFELVCGENLEIKTPRVARDASELRAFLTDVRNYPLFGKPVEAFQSLGSIALRRYDTQNGQLQRTDGGAIALDDFVADVTTNYARGYLFQKLVSPHPTMRELCGDRLATARIVTIATEAGPKVFRASLKIPTGANSADNFWRSGNLLAQLDIGSGRIMRVITGAGVDLVQVTQHPDTGKALIGATVPNWDRMIATALAGAKVMQHFSMIGWDVAAAETGAVIVEMNETPDLSLHQLVEGRGILEPEFLAFMDHQERQAKAHERRMRADINKL